MLCHVFDVSSCFDANTTGGLRQFLPQAQLCFAYFCLFYVIIHGCSRFSQIARRRVTISVKQYVAPLVPPTALIRRHESTALRTPSMAFSTASTALRAIMFYDDIDATVLRVLIINFRS